MIDWWTTYKPGSDDPYTSLQNLVYLTYLQYHSPVSLVDVLDIHTISSLPSGRKMVEQLAPVDDVGICQFWNAARANLLTKLSHVTEPGDRSLQELESHLRQKSADNWEAIHRIVWRALKPEPGQLMHLSLESMCLARCIESISLAGGKHYGLYTYLAQMMRYINDNAVKIQGLPDAFAYDLLCRGFVLNYEFWASEQRLLPRQISGYLDLLPYQEAAVHALIGPLRQPGKSAPPNQSNRLLP